jgi:hypothetical protein
MSTLEQIEDFSTFAKSRLGSDDSVSIDELYSQWRGQAFKDVDQMAVAASVRDLEAGERGQLLDEFIAEFDSERKAKK